MPDNLVRHLREKKRLSRQAFAILSGINRRRIKNIEIGELPTPGECIRIADALNINIEEIFPNLPDKELAIISKLLDESHGEESEKRKWMSLEDLNKREYIDKIFEERKKQEEFLEHERRIRYEIEREKSDKIRELEDQLSIYSNGILIREMSFPSEYQAAGITILQGFISLLKKRYVNEDVSVIIEQRDLKVVMRIKANHNIVEEIEEYLDKYSMVVAGRSDILSLTDDSLEILELKNQLTIAYLQIRQQKEINSLLKNSYKDRLKELKDQNLWFKESLSNSLISQKEQVNAALDLLKENNKLHTLGVEIINEIQRKQEGKGSVSNIKDLIYKVGEVIAKDGIGKGTAEAIKRLIKLAIDSFI